MGSFQKGIGFSASAVLAFMLLSGASFANDVKDKPKAKESAAIAKDKKDKPKDRERTKKPVTITSDQMEADRNSNLVVFKGNVVAVEDFTICSDILYVHYDGNNEVNEIEAEGKVVIFQDEKVSNSAKAVYKRVDRSVILTGNPQVKQCSDTVKGDRITVYLDSDRAFVESGGSTRVKAVIMPDKKCEGTGTTPEKGLSEEARCKGAR